MVLKNVESTLRRKVSQEGIYTFSATRLARSTVLMNLCNPFCMAITLRPKYTTFALCCKLEAFVVRSEVLVWRSDQTEADAGQASVTVPCLKSLTICGNMEPDSA